MVQNFRLIVIAGFALFSMFFGSGNLVFPLQIGVQTLDQCSYALMGFITTGVLVPFIGFMSMVLNGGDRRKFFAYLGKKPAFVITIIILLIMGPLGVAPRCLIVGYGGVKLMDIGIPFWIFSALFSILIGAFIWNPNRIIAILGMILTPWLLAGVFLLIITGLWMGFEPASSAMSSFNAGCEGFIRGYQTTDLPIAFFFSVITIEYIHLYFKEKEATGSVTKTAIYAGLIGTSLLAIIYIGFATLGAKYAPILGNTQPEEMLGIIAGSTLGIVAIPAAAIVIALACLTTAISLMAIFAEFLTTDIFQGRVNHHWSILITVISTFFVSLIGFDNLAVFLGGILEILYPALIVFAIAVILNKLFQFQYVKSPFWLTIGGMGGLKLLALI
ncbi:MAG: hypothetical protein HOI80_02660 [Alphaproteobacteria bacterium]|jgi:branched-chain amino acid:cation transporter, LIVCS family|nr:hypothetical protein [Alphaproteobacteria bacterium]MBT5389462.1 hypothetical protein [Alphaproteobacteria bacterium]MBT5540493.1 hypothetical protein [Alphaproteobacteria bacterium]MBT5654386.1 hypothetical protein [Alphaproteobacteria bacterium]